MTIAQNRDARIPSICFNEPVLMTGRFTGANTANCTPVANTTKSGLTLVRTGVGVHTLTLPTPVGTIQGHSIWLVQPNNTAQKLVQYTPPAANTTAITVTIVLASNVAANTDATSAEELVVEMWTAATQTP